MKVKQEPSYKTRIQWKLFQKQRWSP